MLVAKDFTTLATLPSGALDHAIDRDETNTAVPQTAQVWTGTSAIGTASGAECTGWTVTSGDGTIGAVGSTGPQWTNAGLVSCADTHRFYCIEIDP
jgi:hypothetical protein